MKNTLFIFLAAITILSPFSASAEKPLYIVTTTSQIGDLVRNITGDSAKVEALMGTGIDPHLYHPTRTDVSKLMKADIVFYNGINLEGKMEHFLEQLTSRKPTISIANALALDTLQSMDGLEGYDPHIWMNVNNWIIGGKAVVGALSKIRPKDADIYRKNNTIYTEKLQKLDNLVRLTIASIPREKRILVTAHDAFGYLGTAYDIEVIGVQGISTESEAGLTKIKYLVDVLVERNVPAVFVESSVGDHNIKAIVEGAKARGHNVVIGGSLFSDAMGVEGTIESTYIGMMEYNVNIISKALKERIDG
ncbi:MAG: manganese transporter [Zetaproteobacteria bacterium]|nr:MAG: manganese transporter [Zetaproteobacteria bacterium]